MGIDFKAIGRADPVGTIQNWQTNESNLATASQNRAVSDLNMEKTKQEMGVKQRSINAKIAKEKELDKPMSVEGVKMRMPGGGRPGTGGAYLLDLGRENGLIKMDRGGDGIITPRNLTKLQKMSMEPSVATKVSLMGINTARKELAQAQEEYSKKQTPETQAAIQKANDSLNQALFADESLAKAIPQIEKAKTEAKFSFSFLTDATQKYIDDGVPVIQAKQKALADLEATKKAGKFAPKGSSGTSQIDKSLNSLRDDYMQSIGRYYSSKRGTDQYVPSKDQEAVTNEAYDQAKKIAKRYQEAGGNVGDLGLPDDMLDDKPTGEKLTEEEAIKFLKEAGGDKDKARELAKKKGYTF